MQNVGAMYALQMANYVIPIVALPFLIRTLGAEVYGAMAGAFAAVFFMVVVVDAGSNTLAVRELAANSDSPERVRKIYCINTRLKLVLAAAMAVFLAILVATIAAWREQWVLYLSCYLMVLGSVFFPTWLFQGLEVMRVTMAYSVAGRLLATVGLFAFVSGPDDLVIAAALQASATLLSGLFVQRQVSFFSGASWRDVFRFGESGLGDWWRRVRTLSVSEFATQSTSNSSVFIVSLVTNEVTTGIFAALEKLARAAASGLQPVVRALYPRCSALRAENVTAARRFAARWTAGLLTVSAVGLIIGAVLVPWLLSLLFGAAWIAHTSIMQGLLAWVFLSIASLCVGQLWLLASGETRGYSRVLLAMSALQVLLCIPAVIHAGLWGAAVALVVSEAAKVAGLSVAAWRQSTS